MLCWGSRHTPQQPEICTLPPIAPCVLSPGQGLQPPPCCQSVLLPSDVAVSLLSPLEEKYLSYRCQSSATTCCSRPDQTLIRPAPMHHSGTVAVTERMHARQVPHSCAAETCKPSEGLCPALVLQAAQPGALATSTHLVPQLCHSAACSGGPAPQPHCPSHRPSCAPQPHCPSHRPPCAPQPQYPSHHPPQRQAQP